MTEVVRRQYTSEFKKEAVELVTKQNYSVTEAANLDKGSMWPIAFALTELTSAEEARIAALVKKSVS